MKYKKLIGIIAIMLSIFALAVFLSSEKTMNAFSGCPKELYKIQNNHVYSLSQIIPDADPKTFTILSGRSEFDQCSGYAQDGKHIYYFYDALPVFADIKSFSVLERFFAKDSSHVYFGGVPIDDADVATFSLLKDPKGEGTLYSKDKSHVYVSSPQSRETKVVENADPSSFMILVSLTVPCLPEKHDCNNGNFPFGIVLAKDENSVFGAFGDVISEADSTTFEVLKDPADEFSIYSKDNKHIYAGNLNINTKILLADYSTFNVLSQTEAQDKNHTYFEGEIVK